MCKRGICDNNEDNEKTEPLHLFDLCVPRYQTTGVKLHKGHKQCALCSILFILNGHITYIAFDPNIH